MFLKTRFAVSVPNNIAEGFDRSSDAEFHRFLYFSLASCSEVKSMLCKTLIEQTTEVHKLVQGLISYIKNLFPENRLIDFPTY